MSHRADTHLLSEINKYGATNIESCFNCGNCSAVCPLSTENGSFPRRMIRYAQIGMREKLLASKELWLCYYCGECTATCPRQADPGAFMAAARRYAIGAYDRLGLAKRLYTSAVFNALFLFGLTALLTLFIYSIHGPMPGDMLRLFDFIPSEQVHNLGVVAAVLILLMTTWSAMNMIRHLGRETRFSEGGPLNWLAALQETIGEVLGQARYRRDCELYANTQPLYLQKWFIHVSIVWGFLGLFLATALDYMLELLGVKATGTWVPIWYPVRLLGTLAGLMLIYGVTVALLKRWLKSDEASADSVPSDWTLLILSWLAGMTGFALEIAIYLPDPPAWGYWMLLAHLVIVGDLFILLPFTKFAHALYRPIALYFHALKTVPQAVPATAGAAD